MENDVILNLALRQGKYWVTCACGCFLYRCAGGGADIRNSGLNRRSCPSSARRADCS